MILEENWPAVPGSAGSGVGRAHLNRHPQHGDRASWLHRAEEIVARIEESRQQYFDRGDIESIFNLRKNASWRLMRQVGSTGLLDDALGISTRLKLRVIARKDLLLFIRDVVKSGGFITARNRRDRVEFAIADAAKLKAARRVTIRPDPSVQDIASLPAGVKLTRGKLEIEFAGAAELATQLFALAQAIAGDFFKFQSMLD